MSFEVSTITGSARYRPLKELISIDDIPSMTWAQVSSTLLDTAKPVPVAVVAPPLGRESRLPTSGWS
uniref:Galactarate dehydratase n=1 Tax=Steinernema glaseri TaxID=37863 RepID=A0A1I7YB55_9BILA